VVVGFIGPAKFTVVTHGSDWSAWTFASIIGIELDERNRLINHWAHSPKVALIVLWRICERLELKLIVIAATSGAEFNVRHKRRISRCWPIPDPLCS